MNKIYFVLVFFTFNCATAQIINFPDSYFKSRLITTSSALTIAYNAAGQPIFVDVNDNNEIEVSEALAVHKIQLIGTQVQSLVGIEYFTNLTELECYNNQITSLDLNALVNLRTVLCQNNQLQSLTLSNLTMIKTVDCRQNQLTSLVFSNEANMEVLHCANNLLTSITAHFQGTGLMGTRELWCENNLITSLNLSGSIGTLVCHHNMLTSLNINDFSVNEVDCSYNALTTLTVEGSYHIEQIHCVHNQLTAINFPDVSPDAYENLFNLECWFNNLTELDLSNLKSLNRLNCGLNNLTVLDLTNNQNMNSIKCFSNPNLTTLLAKVSTYQLPIGSLDFSDCPLISYICAKETDFALVQNRLTTYGITNCEVNSYCSFTSPTTPYRLEGTSTLSATSDCATTTQLYPNMRLRITGNSQTRTVITDNSGFYSVPFQTGSYTVTPIVPGSFFYSQVYPSVSNVVFPASTNPLIRNFCISPTNTDTDLQCMIVPIGIAVPGFDSSYKMIYKNNGATTQSGSITLSFDDDLLDLVGVPLGDPVVSANTITWNYTDLQPYQTVEVNLSFNINSPLETPPGILGEYLQFITQITGSTTDIDLYNNTYNYQQKLVSSYDPNNKTCLEGSYITPAQAVKPLHYMIRFENLGTANAHNVVIKDIIDTTKYNIESLTPVYGSHNFYTRITNPNTVEFIFENINLPFDDANNDGYVIFTIRANSAAIGNSFSNSANIYFDYNAPILTNTATTTVAILSNQDFEFSDYFSIYPNPAYDKLNIQSKDDIAISSVGIYNTLGQLVLVVPISGKLAPIDVSDLTFGNYFVKINSDKGVTNTKFIKK